MKVFANIIYMMVELNYYYPSYSSYWLLFFFLIVVQFILTTVTDILFAESFSSDRVRLFVQCICISYVLRVFFVKPFVLFGCNILQITVCVGVEVKTMNI